MQTPKVMLNQVVFPENPANAEPLLLDAETNA
jgi:hypothetical protein